MTSRGDKIFHALNCEGLGLEIGPSYSPMMPKRDGWNVEIADHLDAQSLRNKYAAWGVDGAAIEDVDYVIGEGGLFAAIGKESRFDFIVASHVIEHVPDVVQFLVDCEKLLKPDGVLSLVVPDKNFCFDLLKPLTTTGQILQAHLERRSRHSPGTIFDAHALHARTRDGAIVWTEAIDPAQLELVHTLGEAKQIMDDYVRSTQFIDVHAWQFIPASFDRVISDCAQMGLINFEVEVSFGTAGHEFFISLRKKVDRLARAEDDKVQLAKLAAAGEAAPVVSSQPEPQRQYYLRHEGVCPICEAPRSFVAENAWLRDYLLCSGCLSVPRERAVMRVIAEVMPDWRNLLIHESSPADRGVSRKLRLACGGYVATQFDPSMAAGQVCKQKGYRNEDLGAQTFPDESFDIVVTQDVFEHLPDPSAAIREIARTLKPNGVHIASVPLIRKWSPSRPRARLNPVGVVDHILEPEYHGNPIDEKGALVFTDWGFDIAAYFQQHSGMDTVILHINDIDCGILADFIEIVVSRKVGVS